MNKKILIVSQSHLCRNPRVLKESLLLSKEGYTVTILTAIYSQKMLEEDLDLLINTGIKYEYYSDLRHFSLRSLLARIVKRFASHINSLFKIESKYSLGVGLNRLLKKCKEHEADLYIMHQEVSLLIGCSLLKKKYNVAFDLEDWYSEDLLESARKKRPIKLMRKAEKYAVQNSKHCYTTSKCLASTLMGDYCPNQIISVIYNSFDTVETLYSNDHAKNIRLYWFSQKIGPGRGLEFFIDCMTKSNINWSLALRGYIDEKYKIFLLNKVSQKDKIIFLPFLRNEELLDDFKNYDLGLALEPASPKNKNLTISNKFFHYMAGGLPIIASDTLGHSEIGIKHPEIIFLYKNNHHIDLVNLLNKIGTTIKPNLFNIKKQVIDTYEANYSWGNESKKLIQIIKDATK